MNERDGAVLLPALQEELKGIVRLGLVQAVPVAVGPSGTALGAEIDRTCADLAARHAGLRPAEIEGTAPARALYRAFGIDPTRHRPSSEALLRRIIAGKPFPRILNAVDLCNLIALRFLLSPGLYDLDRIEPPVAIRRGRQGESYEGIRKDRVNLEGRPVLADALGPFGNPTSDSLRTRVTGHTRALWLVLFAPRSYPVARMEDHVHQARAEMERQLAPPGATVITAGRVV